MTGAVRISYQYGRHYNLLLGKSPSNYWGLNGAWAVSDGVGVHGGYSVTTYSEGAFDRVPNANVTLNRHQDHQVALAVSYAWNNLPSLHAPIVIP